MSVFLIIFGVVVFLALRRRLVNWVNVRSDAKHIMAISDEIGRRRRREMERGKRRSY